jgi:sugar lactone lactonase YvrE
MPVYHFRYEVVRDGETVEGEPRSIAVDDHGRVFVVDNRVPELSVLDPKGELLGTIAAPEDNCGKPHGFDHVARGPGSLVYASITCSPRLVAVIDGSFEVTRVIRLDSPAEKQACITGLAVGANGNVYVTDACAKEMVQVFDKDGAFLRGFGKHNNGFKNFSFAAGIAVMDNGDMWVADAIRGTVSRFSADGEFISYVQGDDEMALTYPSGISTDGSSRLFVLEQGGNRFQCFELTGPSQTAGGAQP